MDTEQTMRIDYLKLQFRVDSDILQSQVIPEIERIEGAALDNIENARRGKWTTLYTKVKKQTIYIYEAWGLLADEIAKLLPQHRWGAVTRIDLRRELYNITPADMKWLQTFYSTHSVPKLGVNTFSTPQAFKTNQRDVGGIGIRFGSRKSDQHVVLYYRGKEGAAIEYRLQGKTCDKVMSDLQNMWNYNPEIDQYGSAVNTLFYYLMEYTNKYLGVKTLTDFREISRACAVNFPLAQDDIDPEEVRRADDWWASLSEDTQRDWQQSTFDVTLKKNPNLT